MGAELRARRQRVHQPGSSGGGTGTPGAGLGAKGCEQGRQRVLLDGGWGSALPCNFTCGFPTHLPPFQM